MQQDIEEETSVVVQDDAQLINNKQSAESLISKAIDKNVSVETMERLMAMRRELKAEVAKELFDRAMASFQTDCPMIIKTKEVRTNGNKVAYKYAPIESIVEQVKPFLKQHGFSYSIQQKFNDEKKQVKIICNVKHSAGHAESYEMEVPLGTRTGIMSETQVVAAASTFAKRYAFCNAFGILTGDDDTDARPQANNKSMQNNNNYRQPVQKINQPVQPPKADPKKAQIVTLCNKLGIKDKSKDGYAKFVQEKISTELKPDKYNLIISSLSVLLDFEEVNSPIEVEVVDPPKYEEPWKNDPRYNKSLREEKTKSDQF